MSLLHEFVLTFDCLESVTLKVCLGCEVIVVARIVAMALAVTVVLILIGNVVCQCGLAVLVVVFIRSDFGELLPSLGLDLLLLWLRVSFKGVDFKLTHIFLQFKVLVLQLLHQFVILLNFLTFLLQFLNSFHRTNLLYFILLQFLF